MHKQWGIYYGRLERFLSVDYMREMNIVGQLVKKRQKEGIEIQVWSPTEKVSFCEAKDAKYQSTTLQEDFGPSWSTHWFKITVKEYGDGPVWFHWKSEAESMAWTEDGKPVHGLSSQDRTDFELKLVANNGKGAATVFYIELACNWIFGNGEGSIINPPLEDRRYKVTECELREYNQ
jgi:alpha-mannosidase